MSRLFTVLIFSSLFAAACAHKAEKALDAKLNAEAPVTQEQLSKETVDFIKNTPGLTDEQRKKLMQLRDETRQQIAQKDGMSMKLRSTLFHDLTLPKTDRKEVALLKSRIKKVEKEKTNLLLEAIEKASVILGKEAPRNPNQLDDIYNMLSHDPVYRMQYQ